ncbi:MAG TPA: putative quinol monooxygenase [Pirellulales bacterium]|nr:putative quinol monooxygenase [Pirellulales bacterium]
MIHVIASIRVAAGRRAEFLKEFHALVPAVKAEAGCIDYGPTVDVASGIPVQGALRDDVVTVVERWKDLDALKAHLVAPHMQTYREKVKGLVLGMELQVLEPA